MEVAGIDRDTFYNIVVLFTETKIFILHAHDFFWLIGTFKLSAATKTLEI